MEKQESKWIPFWFMVASFTCFGSFCYSMHVWEWHWFGRSGSVVVLCGGVMAGIQLFESGRRSKAEMHDFWAKARLDFPNPSPEDVERAGLDSFRPLIVDQHDRWMSEYLGFWFLAMGTLIWGYGDLPGVIWQTRPASF